MNRSLDRLKARCERLRSLDLACQAIHSTLDPEKALDLVLRHAVRLTDASSGSIVLVNPTTGFLETQAARGLPPQAARLGFRVGEGLAGWVVRTGRPARVADVLADPRYIMVRPQIRSELAAPLEVSGEVRGAILVGADRPGAFGVEAQALLLELARRASGVIRNTWLHEQLRHKARLFESLFVLGQSIQSALSLGEALGTITRAATTLMDGKMSALHLLDEERAWLDLRASHGAGAAYLTNSRLSVDESLLGTVVRRRKPLQVADVRTSTRYQRVGVAREEGLVSLVSVPLVFQRRPIGTLSVYTGQPHSFSNEEIRILSALAELSAIAIEKARLYERLVEVEHQLRKNEKLSVLGLLAAEVAHEIRNPLAVMQMLYHSLDLRFPEGDPRARDAQIMGEKMVQLNRIVDRILDLARSPEPRFASVNVNPLLSDLALLTRHKFREQNVRLVLELDPRLPSVPGDATQLEQAFLNLALNAAEAMPQGGQLTISTAAAALRKSQPAPTHVRITFRDTGQGMSDEQQRRAFSALLSTTKSKGAGLGLAIVARIVEAHRGKVRLASRLGHGTTLHLLLPV
ncbi:MAG TPA: GAF domain-containing protein [Verrucomicrobiota bacterium]|nr:GAF domain-containing protein [Verrucomicrobiota bacterium]HRZ35518.1 GAF domain-containing protein [Candidatus Paceibacterota bacterium]HRZ53858.1 GAF domain-containing protein [Candidatus Paceibacterota bacterium]